MSERTNERTKERASERKNEAKNERTNERINMNDMYYFQIKKQNWCFKLDSV